MTLPTEGLNDLNHLKKRTLKDADKLTNNINDPQLAFSWLIFLKIKL